MMMSIVEQFGKRRHEPVMPPAPTRTAVASVPHEKQAQALAFVTKLNDEVDGLRDENGRLRADLNLSMMRCRDLETQLTAMRADTEAYRRYSVEVKTHLQHIVDVAIRANEAAIEAGEVPADKQAEQVINDTERDLREKIGQKFGAGAVIDNEPQHG